MGLAWLNPMQLFGNVEGTIWFTNCVNKYKAQIVFTIVTQQLGREGAGVNASSWLFLNSVEIRAWMTLRN